MDNVRDGYMIIQHSKHYDGTPLITQQRKQSINISLNLCSLKFNRGQSLLQVKPTVPT